MLQIGSAFGEVIYLTCVFVFHYATVFPADDESSKDGRQIESLLVQDSLQPAGNFLGMSISLFIFAFALSNFRDFCDFITSILLLKACLILSEKCNLQTSELRANLMTVNDASMQVYYIFLEIIFLECLTHFGAC